MDRQILRYPGKVCSLYCAHRSHSNRGRRCRSKRSGRPVRLKAHSPSVFHGSSATPAWLMRLTQPTGSLSPDICRCGMIHRNMWLPAWAPKVVNTLDQMMALIALGNFNSPADKTSSGFGWIGSTVLNIKTGVRCFLWTLCLRIAWNPTV